jgi:hypothetical protein
MIQNCIGSSETTREPPFYSFDFTNYIKYHRPEHKCKADSNLRFEKSSMLLKPSVLTSLACSNPCRI